MELGDASTPVLVLKYHHGSLGIGRSLGRLGVPVYGVDADPGSPALASRFCRRSFTWNFGRADPEESVAFLGRVAGEIGPGAILVPTCDDTALLVARFAETLSRWFLFPRQDPELVRSFSNKKLLYALARRYGVPTAETAFPLDRRDVERFAEEAAFPLMLKAIDGLRLEARTGRKMLIVHSPDELLAQYDALEDPAEPNLMVQEYIPGGDDTIWMFNGYFDEHSECLVGFTGRKLRQHPIHLGSTSLGVCERNDEVDRLTRTLMKSVGYRGVLDIGFRFDARDGRYKLLDPNPRVGSTFRLFVGEDGLDVVRAQYLHLTGRPVAPSRLVEGRKWIVEDQDVESSLDYAAERTLTFRQWLASLRGVREGAWFAWDDPVPFARMVRRRVAGSVRGRLGRRLTSLPLDSSAGSSNEPSHQDLSRQLPVRNGALPPSNA